MNTNTNNNVNNNIKNNTNDNNNVNNNVNNNNANNNTNNTSNNNINNNANENNNANNNNLNEENIYNKVQDEIPTNPKVIEINKINIPENNDKSENNTERRISVISLDPEKEKEIEAKVNEYKNELHNNFLKILEEGKKADEKRNEEIKNESDPEKKKKMEQENMQEKLLLAKKLKQVKEDMEIKVSAYEKKLKEEK